MTSKLLNTIKKFQNPDGPIAGYPIFDAWSFNENWLFNRKHLGDNSFQKGLDKQIHRAEKVEPQIDPSLPPLTGSPDDVYGAYEWWHPRKIYLNQDLVDSNGKPKPGREDDLGTTIVHEKAHSLFWLLWNKSPQAKKMRELKDDANYEDYQILQEIRWRYGLNPKSDLNDGDVNHLIRLINQNGNKFHIKFLERFNGKLKDVFNLVADSGEKSKKDITYAQSGTKLLVPHKDYLGVPYKQDDYDYFSAHPTNMPTQSGEHWTSRNPITGQLLKSENHPTFNLQMQGEKEAGMETFIGLNGKLYSFPKIKPSFIPSESEQKPLYLQKYGGK